MTDKIFSLKKKETINHRLISLINFVEGWKACTGSKGEAAVCDMLHDHFGHVPV